MGYQNIFKRYELKYLITKEQRKIIQTAMKDYMQPDKFGNSSICNIYFDTPERILVRRSNEKPVYKEKLRVRSYGIAVSSSTVFIELKKKYDGVVYKRRIETTLKESISYLEGRIPLQQPSQISKEIDYFYKFYDRLEPATYISYEREAYYSKTDSDFRMTFDENILYRDYDLSLSKGNYGESLMKKNMVLLEVKTALGMPIWLIHILSENKIYKTTFSKYGNAYDKMMLPQQTGGIYVA